MADDDGGNHVSCGFQEPPAVSAPTTAKPRGRQVAARYLQPKPPPVPHGGLGSAPLTGRASLAGGYGSASWVELQHPNHAATPLMVPSGSAGPGLCSTVRAASKSRSGLGLPTPRTSTVRRPAPPAAAAAAEQQFVTPGPVATPRFGAASSRGSMRAPDTVLSTQQACLQTPRGLSASAAISRPQSTAGKAGGLSADLTGVVLKQPQAADADMRAKLSAWREMKQQQQQPARTAAKPGVFKEPAPKPTLFRATAATRINKDAPTGKRAAASASSQPLEGEASSSAAAAAGVSRRQSLSGGGADSNTVGSAGASAGASPSAFTATMATLQHSGGKTRKASSKASGSKPSPVPPLKLTHAGLNSSSHAAADQPTPARIGRSPQPPAVGSATKIPKLNLAGLIGDQQQQQQQQQQQAVGTARQQQLSSRAPLSSRRPSSSAAAATVPDATPRAVRDAMPSRLPRTPRSSTPGASYQHDAGLAATPEGNDRAAGLPDTSKASAEERGVPEAAGAKPVVPKLKLGAVLGARSPGPIVGAAAGTLQNSRPAGHSCLSARGSRASAATQGTPPAKFRTCSEGGAAGGTPGSAQQRGRTPRVSAAAAAAGSLPTPRSLTSSSNAATAAPVAAIPAASAAPAAAAGAAPTARRAEADRADEVRQQLRLLSMQQLQLRHLNARLEAALRAKQQKMSESVAAAAAAVVDLSGQLVKANHQAQRITWQSQLRETLQQQLAKLKAWGGLQAQHQANICQLQAACGTALSHVPLLNGATVGHNPEQPDLQALQRQLQQGMQLLADLQPSLQQLLSGEASCSAAVASSAGNSSSSSSSSGPHLHPKGIQDTAALSRDLLAVAAEECALLQQLNVQLAELSDLQLYVNSMQVQLQHIKQPLLEGSAGVAVM